MTSKHDKLDISISLKDARRIVDGLELAATWDKTEIYYPLKAWVKQADDQEKS